MDKELESDLARLDRETVAHKAASEQRMEWAEKETRHNENIRSLLQLLINRATEINQQLSTKAVQQATRLGIAIPNQIHPIKITLGTVESEPKLEEPQIQDLPTANKTEFVRKLISIKAASGVTPSEIKKTAKSLKMSMAGNFPHTILHKLKTNGEIKEEGGKYYPAEEWL
jgi:hypothetical protein